jgi:hypothetical protein
VRVRGYTEGGVQEVEYLNSTFKLDTTDHMQIIKRALYEEIDEQLQDLIANSHIHPREEYFRRASPLFNF